MLSFHPQFCVSIFLFRLSHQYVQLFFLLFVSNTPFCPLLLSLYSPPCQPFPVFLFPFLAFFFNFFLYFLYYLFSFSFICFFCFPCFFSFSSLPSASSSPPFNLDSSHSLLFSLLSSFFPVHLTLFPLFFHYNFPSPLFSTLTACIVSSPSGSLLPLPITL